MESLAYLAQRSCHQKVYHRTAKRAEQEARRLSKLSGEPLQAYPCHHCDGYHVGHADSTQQILITQAKDEERAKAMRKRRQTMRPLRWARK